MKKWFDRWAARWSLKSLANVAAASLILLIFWTLAWELWVAPLRPGGSWLALKALLLLLPLRGILAERRYTFQWASMFILLFFGEAVVRAWGDLAAASRWMAWGELLLSLVFFVVVVLFARASRPGFLVGETQLQSTETKPH